MCRSVRMCVCDGEGVHTLALSLSLSHTHTRTQIERLCKQQSENKRLEQTMNATEADLSNERALVHKLQVYILKSRLYSCFN